MNRKTARTTGDSNDILYDACDKGHIDTAKFLLSNGAFDKQRAYNIACKRGHIDIMQLLIVKGVFAYHYFLVHPRNYERVYKMIDNTLFNPIIYWTIIYDRIKNKKMIQRDLIPELFMLMDFNKRKKFVWEYSN